MRREARSCRNCEVAVTRLPIRRQPLLQNRRAFRSRPSGPSKASGFIHPRWGTLIVHTAGARVERRERRCTAGGSPACLTHEAVAQPAPALDTRPEGPQRLAQRSYMHAHQGRFVPGANA